MRRSIKLDHILAYCHFWQSGVHQTQQSSQEACVHQVSIFVNHIQVHLQTPRQSALNNAQSLSVNGSRRLQHFINETGYVNSHLRHSVSHISVLTRMQQGREFDVKAVEAFVRFAWLWRYEFQGRSCYHLGLADFKQDLPVLTAEFDIHRPKHGKGTGIHSEV